MAITLITVPNDVTAAYNPLTVTCSSDNTAQPNFKYIFQVVVDSVTLPSVKLSPRPNGYAVFDAHRIVENYLSSNFNVGEATDAYACPQSSVDIEIKVGEEYGTPPAEYLNLDSCSSTCIAAALKHSTASFYGSQPNFIDVDYRSQYMMSNLVTGANKPFLTTSPRTITICDNKNYYLYALVNVGQEPPTLRLRTYDSSGSIISTYNKTLSSTSEYIVRYAVGTKNINLWNASYLTGVSSYDIRLFNAPGIGIPAPISELFTFNIDCDCSKYPEQFRLHWLNPLGGFDAKSFNMRFDRNMELKKSFFTKILGSQDDGTGEYTFAVTDSGKINFNTVATETIVLNTNWITEEESKWLFTLSKSTTVYWEIAYNIYAPVTVTDLQYQQKVYATEKLFNFTVKVEIGNEIISQRG